MKKEKLPCPISIGEFNRFVANMETYKKLNDDQIEWLEGFLERHDFNLRTCVLKIEEGILWVIVNTKNSVKEFEDIEGGSRWD